MLYHITTRRQADGFVHCSLIEQLVEVADAFFEGQEDLVVLEIAPAAIESLIRTENLLGGDELFPHVYGEIPWTSVRAVHELPLTDRGQFTMPEMMNSTQE